MFKLFADKGASETCFAITLQALASPSQLDDVSNIVIKCLNIASE